MDIRVTVEIDGRRACLEGRVDPDAYGSSPREAIKWTTREMARKLTSRLLKEPLATGGNLCGLRCGERAAPVTWREWEAAGQEPRCEGHRGWTREHFAQARQAAEVAGEHLYDASYKEAVCILPDWKMIFKESCGACGAKASGIIYESGVWYCATCWELCCRTPTRLVSAPESPAAGTSPEPTAEGACLKCGSGDCRGSWGFPCGT